MPVLAALMTAAKVNPSITQEKTKEAVKRQVGVAHPRSVAVYRSSSLLHVALKSVHMMVTAQRHAGQQLSKQLLEAIEAGV